MMGRPVPGLELPRYSSGGLTVSAVIPAYNAAETIERALNSVYAQTYPNIIEVIVVDDGSTDATAQIVREKFPQVTLIQQENRGASAARNSGVRATRHDLVAFLDADDEWLPTKIAIQVAALQTLPTDSVVFTTSQTIPYGSQTLDGEGMKLMTRLRQRLRASRLPKLFELSAPDIVRNGGGVCSASLLLRRTTYERVGGYDESIRVSEDYTFFLSLLAAGVRLWLLNQPLYCVHARPNSLHRSAEAGGSVARLEAFERVDPRHSDIGRALFTQEAYEDAFQVRLLVEAIFHIDQGLLDKGRVLIERAVALGRFDWARTLVLRIGQRNPCHLKPMVRAMRHLGILRL